VMSEAARQRRAKSEALMKETTTSALPRHGRPLKGLGS
jgi:hypothetical protein